MLERIRKYFADDTLNFSDGIKIKMRRINWWGLTLLISIPFILLIGNCFFPKEYEIFTILFSTFILFLSIILFFDTKTRWRIFVLLGVFTVSLFIAIVIIKLGSIFIYKFTDDVFHHDIVFRGLLYSIPPLPLFLTIWLFRHTDTQKNLNQNALFEAQKLMIAPDDSSKILAILKLHQLLKEVPQFEKEVYSALSAGLKQHSEWDKKLSLNIRVFNLKNQSFEDADFRYENLQEAALRGANLQNADLQNAKLSGADLRDADLSGATMGEVTNMILILKDAIFNDKTNITTLAVTLSHNKRATIEKEYKMKHEDTLTPEELKKLNERHK